VLCLHECRLTHGEVCFFWWPVACDRVCVCVSVCLLCDGNTQGVLERGGGGNGWGPTPPTRIPSASFFIFRTLCKVCIKLLFLRLLLFVFLICSEYFSFSLLHFPGVPDPWQFGTDPDPRIRTVPYLWLTDLAPDPALFVCDLQDDNKEYKSYFAYYFLKVHLHYSSKIISQKSHKTSGY
jgi:hypothetical protein